MDDHARAHIDALLVDLSLVVHGDVAHGDPAHDHRLDVGYRRQHSRAADVALDRLHVRLGFLGGVLEGHRPARRAGDKPKLQLLVEAVGLDHHAVDLVLQRVLLLLPLGELLEEILPTLLKHRVHGVSHFKL